MSLDNAGGEASTTAQTLTVTAFVLERIADDEVLAHEVLTWRQRDMDRRPGNYPAGYDPGDDSRTYAADGNKGKPVYVVGPARVLAECQAKRRIVAIHAASTLTVGEELSAISRRAVQALAAVYADHQDYRDEWRP